MKPRKLASLAIPLSAALLLAGCGDDTSSQNEPDEGPTGQTPQLLTWDKTASSSMEALVHGALSVNDAGCFALGADVLLAPPGSKVVNNGDAIRVPNIGKVDVGDDVDGSGGYLTATDAKFSEAELSCLPDDGSDPEFAVLDHRGDK
ncbi:hypothetical protein [Solicola gregarius]|uniref:Lipoprotein n=1 Tax=Solicola gregarius TaxID=2908642 RepID=A0AA46THU8_9ACTN|nr:hypothetical protein [Solicola gregarius]UYM05634.1 hypothetical protein L0C25_00680 [Solicola gregarius]